MILAWLAVAPMLLVFTFLLVVILGLIFNRGCAMSLADVIMTGVVAALVFGVIGGMILAFQWGGAQLHWWPR